MLCLCSRRSDHSQLVLGADLLGDCPLFILSASTIITLLQIVTLHRVFGEMHSATRSMMLLIVNVVQILYMYAAWYYVTTNDPGRDFLMEALYVFATIGHPDKVPLHHHQTADRHQFSFCLSCISRWGIKPGDAKKQDTNV
jgi:hypothetical protein